MTDPVRAALLAPRLARWLEARWRDAVPLPRAIVQLYGLEVIDFDGIEALDPTAVRTTFIAEHADESTLLASADAAQAVAFDATATVEHTWAPAEHDAPRPGHFVGRRRMVTVRVVSVRY